MTLLPTHQADRMMSPIGHAPRRGGARLASPIASVMAHLAALALVVSVVAKAPPAPPDAVPVPLVFSAPATTTLLSQQALATAAGLQVLGLHPVAPMTATAVPARPAFPPLRAATPMPQTRPGRAAPQPVAAPEGNLGAGPLSAAPPRRAAPGMDDNAVLLRFTADVHAVVQAAATMPRAAALQHREGRTQVRFAYLDGHVEAVAVAQSSRSRLLDDAALAAVQRAHYPPPPATLRGRRLTLLEWIDFRIATPAPG